MTSAKSMDGNEIRLVKVQASRFAGMAGEECRGACPVVVCSKDGLSSLPDVTVLYRVVKGPACFARTNESTELEVRTDERGRASADVRFTGAGAIFVSARIPGRQGQIVGFHGRTEGVTDAVTVLPESSCVKAGSTIRVIVAAVDWRRAPIHGAHLIFEATGVPDVILQAEVRELGNGMYEAALEIERAGSWVLTAQDTTTLAFGRAVIQVVPGRPREILVVAEPRPRKDPPRDVANLRVALVDGFGNPLPASRLVATVGEESLPRSIFGDEARFSVVHRGSGTVAVSIQDSESGIQLDYQARFHPVHLDVPRIVVPETTFATPLRLFPRSDAPLEKATVTVSYDPKLTRFLKLDSSDSHPAFAVAIASQEASRIAVSIEVKDSERRHSETPGDGIYVGTPEWECLGPGETCFRTSARMSPESEETKDCAWQKWTGEETELCLNFVYHGWADVSAPTSWQIESYFDSFCVLESCCPNFDVVVHHKEVSDDDWEQVLDKLGEDDKATTQHEVRQAASILGSYQRADCIDVFLMDFGADWGPSGMAERPGGEWCAADPNAGPNTFAHEVAHCLGLTDLYKYKTENGRVIVADPGPRGNLMSAGAEPRDCLTREQCDTIKRTLGLQ